MATKEREGLDKCSAGNRARPFQHFTDAAEGGALQSCTNKTENKANLLKLSLCLKVQRN